MKTLRPILCVGVVLLAGAVQVALAQPAPPSAGPAAGAGPARPVVYPPRPVDPAGVERGRVLYMQNGCAACHGADTRGGTAPALHRRALVLNDVRGERIGPVLLNGPPGVAGHVFKLEPSQIVDIADFIHSQRTVGTGSANLVSRAPFQLGSASAGKAYFEKACATCHSAVGDLAGVGGRVTEPRALQQRWLAPPATKPVMATVAQRGGPVVGEVTELDEFHIALKTAAGDRVIERDGANPKIALNDPLAGHEALLRRISDKDIHDVTAYLVTLK